MRSLGVGSTPLSKLEQFAIAKNVTHCRLETTFFQALAF
ncbi:hypothetical protein [Shewanella sp. XMDDZSB0408]